MQAFHDATISETLQHLRNEAAECLPGHPFQIILDQQLRVLRDYAIGIELELCIFRSDEPRRQARVMMAEESTSALRQLVQGNDDKIVRPEFGKK
ncbi:hypothetical protein IFT84_10170 [Rhizobium sp. CFBP 8762]|uniref:hypothetical protein n=1 Tax=Rhizobium sp. CFBP 8762 TaxID=2775279 RepID=UPI001784A0A9|nr:hypothetical protein [Rhizobium sp. CFBP 8762]MBD8554888.1 hypothetical protein [Rhizobium sp. CFBP 8762]